MPDRSARGKSAAADALYNHAATAVQLLAALAVVAVAVRRLGPEVFGELLIFASWLGIAAIVPVGFQQALIQSLAAYRESGEQNRRIAASFWTFLAFAALVLAGGWIVIPRLIELFRMNHSAALAGGAARLLLLGGALQMIHAHAEGVAWGLGHVANLSKWLIAKTLIAAAAFCAVLDRGAGIWGIAWVYFLSNLISCAVVYAAILRLLPDVSFSIRRASPAAIRELTGPAGSFVGLQIIAVVALKIDDLVIGWYLGAALVTGYSILHRISMAATRLCWSLADVLFPVVAGMDPAAERERIWRLYLVSSRLTLIVSLLLTLMVVTWSPTLIRLWAGPAALPSHDVLLILPFVILLSASIHVGAVTLFGLGRQKIIMLSGLVEAALNLAISILLVRRFQVLGVAMGTLISGVLVNFWFIPFCLTRALGQSFKSYLIRVGMNVLAPGLAAAAALIALLSSPAQHEHLPLLLAASGGILAMGWFYYRVVLSEEERAWIRAAGSAQG